MTNMLVHQEDIVINIYPPNNRAPLCKLNTKRIEGKNRK